MFKIDKGVPVPAPNSKYATLFAKLELGDSFATNTAQERNTVLSCFVAWRKKTASQFTLMSRVQGDGTYRFWLVKP